MFELARIADEYCNGELRITVEQSLTIPNVLSAKVDKLMKKPLLEKYSPPLLANLVACTGSLFCGQAIAETKARSLELTLELDTTMETSPRPIRCISLDAPTLALKFRLRILDSWERWHETRIGSPWKASIFILGVHWL